LAQRLVRPRLTSHMAGAIALIRFTPDDSGTITVKTRSLRAPFAARRAIQKRAAEKELTSVNPAEPGEPYLFISVACVEQIARSAKAHSPASWRYQKQRRQPDCFALPISRDAFRPFRL
jgi:hypothetical protein